MKMAAAVLAAVIAAAAQQGRVFRSGTEAIRIDALVMNGRTPVAGLTAADFEVRDSGVVQRIDSISLGDAPLSVMLALDVSYSMHGEPLGHLKEAAAAVVDLMAASDRAAILAFSQAVALRAPWTADHAALKASISTIEARGSTSLHDALYAALTIRDMVVSRPLVLVFSDGDDTVSWLPGQSIVETARRSDAVVYAVGLNTPGVDAALGYRMDLRSGLQPVVPKVTGTTLFDELLPAVAAETGGKYLDARRSGQLRDAFVQILTEFRTRYLITYVPQGVDKGGWHPIEVKLRSRKGNITARRGYLR